MGTLTRFLLIRVLEVLFVLEIVASPPVILMRVRELREVFKHVAPAEEGIS